MVMSARLRYATRVLESAEVEKRTQCPTHCLVSGATVSTTRGDVRAEMLRVGDKLRTRDGHFAPITGVTARIHESLSAELRPIVFRRGAVSHGVPKRDLVVLPGQPLAKPGMANAEMRPANRVGWRTITQPLVATHVKFVLLTCAADAIINVDGVWAGPNPMAVRLETSGRPARS